MIKCTNCALPALPQLLFWETVLGTRMACLCGCMERDGYAAQQNVDPDFISEMRASDEGMPEQGARPVRRRKPGKFDQWLSAGAEQVANSDLKDGKNPFRSPLLMKY